MNKTVKAPLKQPAKNKPKTKAIVKDKPKAAKTKSIVPVKPKTKLIAFDTLMKGMSRVMAE